MKSALLGKRAICRTRLIWKAVHKTKDFAPKLKKQSPNSKYFPTGGGEASSLNEIRC